MASRAPSIRSTRSRYAPSIAPTLPDGAERMLDGLRPHGRDSDDEEDYEVDGVQRGEGERPQFVLGPELDDDDKDKDKPTVEHREVAESSTPPRNAESRVSTESQRAKGWKEV